MFGFVSRKKYNELLKEYEKSKNHNENHIEREYYKLQRERDLYQFNSIYAQNVMTDAVWLIQKNGDSFKCSNCGHTTVFDLDNIPGTCNHCNKNMIALRNDPNNISQEYINNLKIENRKLKDEMSTMKLNMEDIDESRKFYEDKYRLMCGLIRRIYNTISDKDNQIPEKCPDCGGELFYDPIGHYGMCLQCGKNFNMKKFWLHLKNKNIEIPCTKCRFKVEFDNKKDE